MQIILLSGGSGKRLWPLSNEIRSKVFLKLLPTEDGQRQSMIQRVCGQLDKVGLLPSTTITTNKSQVEITQNHIGDRIRILAEPYKRGTFLAIGLATSYLHSKQQIDLEETICVIPVDLFVESEFYQLLCRLPEIIAESGTELALIGTLPNRPSSQYGYIVPQGAGGSNYSHVSKFVEKPSVEVAEGLIKDQAYWNCGVFAFQLKFMLSCLTSKGLPTQYEELLDRYELFSETSFDEEVVEKSQHAVVVPYNKAWRDLGDWNILSNYLENHVIGHGQISADSLHTHLINELMYPIHVIGVSNIIVAASPDGILVASKDKSNEIKKIVKDKQTAMYEEKRWGIMRVLDHTTKDMEILTKKVEMLAGMNTSYHSHPNRREVWMIISGTGEFIIEGVNHPVHTGDVVQIPYGATHAVKATSVLEFIEIQIGVELKEDDIIRMAMTWEDTIKYCHNGTNPANQA